MEFVRLLLLHDMLGGGREGEVRVGQLPEWLPQIPGVRPVGTVDHDWLSMSAFVAPGADTPARLRRELVAAGWTLPAPRPFATTGGFVQTEQAQADSEDAGLCGPGGRWVQVGGRSHTGDSIAVVVVSARPGGAMQGGGQCLPQYAEATEGARERERSLERPPMPVLYAPATATQRGSGSSSGGVSGEANAHARLTTTIAADELVAHYAEQMLAAGWTPGALAFAGRAAIHVFERVDEGVRWNATLTVIATDDRERRVRLNVERPR
jgi:hypothetical protein